MLGKIEDTTEQAKYFAENICKISADVFLNETEMLKLYAHFVLEIKDYKAEVKREIEVNGKVFKAPDPINDILVGHYVELINTEINEEDYQDMHIVSACIFREDWSKPFSEEEIVRNAQMFYEHTADVAYFSSMLYIELLNLLKEINPILYESKGGYDDSPRKGYDMINILANNDFTKWDNVKNVKLSKAMTFLERIEIQRRNEEQRQRANR